MSISPIYPIILQNGTVADATQVMADFFQIQNDVNANAAHSGANSDITSLTGLTTALAVIYGGTGSTTAAGARTNLSAAAAGANSDITSITGLTTPLAVNQGGTGANVAGATAANNIGAAELGANSSITSLTGLTTPLPITEGGTGATTAADARTNLGVTPALASGTIKAALYYSSGIVSQYNVAGVTRNAPGNYTINFATSVTVVSAQAHPVGATIQPNPTNIECAFVTSWNNNSVTVITGTPGGGQNDVPFALQVA